ncbi:MAG TPA: hypothetical protein VFT09_12085, partial [Ilumatobacteraceae bacterium]|nr:hypothetical protein [Ilumatobacteraceae bacterium]
MTRGTARRLSMVTILLAGLMVPATVAADRVGDTGRGTPVAGARSLGDPLLPQLGNGGYDVEHYTIELDYDPVANTFLSARTTITARATAHLAELSLDFQDDFEITRVTVGARDAGFASIVAEPDLSPIEGVSQPMKLVVTPHPSQRPKAGRAFTVVVEYRGDPQPFVDPDESLMEDVD